DYYCQSHDYILSALLF
nr:immunoglobulin light chain junction region [Macaca mulatta]MOX28344.1 immunoglobulin light chain junction region [Macaca mulatta]MOX28749.1 immunoglobulin light chain junction region [Macaca mulatta]MOX28799.1 immunoglobulin light chain junction region [Macaca mulatta]MOX29007.1 immunoglobulin light chain junction region [Macaca mulatta]